MFTKIIQYDNPPGETKVYYDNPDCARRVVWIELRDELFLLKSTQKIEHKNIRLDFAEDKEGFHLCGTPANEEGEPIPGGKPFKFDIWYNDYGYDTWII